MSTYTTNLKLAKPVLGEPDWQASFDYNWELLDRLQYFYRTRVVPATYPPTNLNVLVGGWCLSCEGHGSTNFGWDTGGTLNTNGLLTGFALPASSHVIIYALCSNMDVIFESHASTYPAWPTEGHIRLAKVITGTAKVTSIIDARLPDSFLFYTLTNAANDAAAAAVGVPVGCLYRNGSTLMIRVT